CGFPGKGFKLRLAMCMHICLTVRDVPERNIGMHEGKHFIDVESVVRLNIFSYYVFFMRFVHACFPLPCSSSVPEILLFFLALKTNPDPVSLYTYCILRHHEKLYCHIQDTHNGLVHLESIL
ncbi:MAG: hypothetical protein LUQ56_04990, partial [Methylococcaceae bacterium]|nr:hypothetical protein [Methylococcaceae bacterium]